MITRPSVTDPQARDRPRRGGGSRRDPLTARASLLVPDEKRTWYHYLLRCPVCQRPHLGRTPELDRVTGVRRLPCHHWVTTVIARTYSQKFPGGAR
jgi:hypothetical protein